MTHAVQLTQLDKYLADLRKGFALTRRLVKPKQVEVALTTLKTGTEGQVILLFKDLCGEALSVAAGPFKKGGEAISAFVEAQALLYVLKRDSAGETQHSDISSLLQEHQKDLRHWILHGYIDGYKECDLSQIGMELLPSFQTRIACPGTAISLSIIETLLFYTVDAKVDSPLTT